MIEWTREVRELTDLALARFPKLTESELKLLCAVTTGEFALCGYLPSDDYENPESHPENHPDSAELWDLERVIHGELIRWLCVNPHAAELIDPRGIRVSAARIDGELDLSHASVGFPLDLAKCRIISPVNLSFAQLDALTLNGSVIAGIVSQGLTVRGDIDFQKGFCAKDGVRLFGADVRGSLSCSGGRFVNTSGYALGADGARVKGDVLLDAGFSAQGEVGLIAVNIGGGLICNGGTFSNHGKNALTADRATVKGSFFLGDSAPDGSQSTKFSADGKIRLLGVDVGHDIAFIGAHFAESSHVDALGAKVRGALLWRGMPNTPVALNLKHASVGPIADDRNSWPQPGKLDLDGLVYSHFATSPTKAESRLKWLSLQNPAEPSWFQRTTHGKRRALYAIRRAVRRLRRAIHGKILWWA